MVLCIYFAFLNMSQLGHFVGHYVPIFQMFNLFNSDIRVFVICIFRHNFFTKEQKCILLGCLFVFRHGA